MILIINFIALYASFSLNHMLAIYWGAVLPVLYALVIAPHALIGRSDIPPIGDNESSHGEVEQC